MADAAWWQVLVSAFGGGAVTGGASFAATVYTQKNQLKAAAIARTQERRDVAATRRREAYSETVKQGGRCINEVQNVLAYRRRVEAQLDQKAIVEAGLRDNTLWFLGENLVNLRMADAQAQMEESNESFAEACRGLEHAVEIFTVALRGETEWETLESCALKIHQKADEATRAAREATRWTD